MTLQDIASRLADMSGPEVKVLVYIVAFGRQTVRAMASSTGLNKGTVCEAVRTLVASGLYARAVQGCTAEPYKAVRQNRTKAVRQNRTNDRPCKEVNGFITSAAAMLPLKPPNQETTRNAAGETPALLYSAMSDVDRSGVDALWRRCRSADPECTAEEVLAEVIRHRRRVTAPNVRNPIGLLLTIVPGAFVCVRDRRGCPTIPPTPSGATPWLAPPRDSAISGSQDETETDETELRDFFGAIAWAQKRGITMRTKAEQDAAIATWREKCAG